jgi:chromosome segregation ATPase
VILGIALVSIKREAAKEQVAAADKIETFSNKWVVTDGKLVDQKHVTENLEKDLETQKQTFVELTNSYSKVSGDLAKTQTDLKAREEEIKQRDVKIADLESQNQALDKQATDLSSAITNLTVQIADTQKKLTTSEGDKAFLEKELRRLITEKVELEKQFNDITVLRAQVSKLREELTIARRIEWIRNGLFASSEQKGAQKLMQGLTPAQSQAKAAKPNYDLNVEVTADGSVRVIPPATNTPAAPK